MITLTVLVIATFFLGTLFFLPLLASPLLAVGIGVVSYVVARGLRVKLNVQKEWCVCAGEV